MEEGKVLMAHRSPRYEAAGLHTEEDVADVGIEVRPSPGTWLWGDSPGPALQVPKRRPHPLGLSRFHQHPESVEVERGGVARFQCLIQGVPEPSISWEHNGTALNTANHRVTLLPSGILHITSVSQADVGTYRCVARNVASTHHSQDAQLTLSVGPPRLLQEPEILSGPQNLTLTVHQTAVLECIATGHPWPLVSWSRLDGRSIGVEGIQVLGTENLMISDMSVQHSGVYVCATNRPGTRVWRTAQGVLLVQEPSGPELQEAVSKGTSEHIFSNLEPATAYTIHLRAYSAEGASQDSAPIFASTTGSTPAALGFSTKVFNATSVQASWELPPQLGPIQGFKLFHRKLPAAHFEGPLLLASSVSSFLYTDLEPAALYEIKLQAFNGNGDGNSSACFVSLRDVSPATPDGTVSTESKTGCSCSQGESSPLPGVVVGIHVGLAALIVCLLCLFLGWRHSLLCKQESQECWAVPRTASDRAGRRQGQTQSGGKPGEKTELTTQVTVEQLALA
ncbi:immunoglobulin superfamily DCC subclass member 3-like isoform X6 [Pongo abelii]|uniref:immunoglobulin superfamily DCC subclass member 3-like isoform X6 n=1 Tax=Pongo abelii TaxID=9601 RepID=UPI0023E86EED|nr:immunoglobulin superfamily DCC subclass member 3-like isoform X6 [Pongo abelii]